MTNKAKKPTKAKPGFKGRVISVSDPDDLLLSKYLVYLKETGHKKNILTVCSELFSLGLHTITRDIK